MQLSLLPSPSPTSPIALIELLSREALILAAADDFKKESEDLALSS